MNDIQASVGDRIKAFDFEPFEGRPDRYVVGTIKRINEYSYIIRVEEDTDAPAGVRLEVYVPFRTMGDFEGRITKCGE